MPQGGLFMSLDFNKSPLGDLGVALKKQDFQTALFFSINAGV